MIGQRARRAWRRCSAFSNPEPAILNPSCWQAAGRMHAMEQEMQAAASASTQHTDELTAQVRPLSQYVCIYTYIYTYICVYSYVYAYVYIYVFCTTWSRRCKPWRAPRPNTLRSCASRSALPLSLYLFLSVSLSRTCLLSLSRALFLPLSVLRPGPLSLSLTLSLACLLSLCLSLSLALSLFASLYVGTATASGKRILSHT